MTDGKWVSVAVFSELEDRKPVSVRIGEVDLLVVRIDDTPHVLFGRCPHRGAKLVDGLIEGDRIVCAEHGWDFCLRSGDSQQVPGEGLDRFECRLDPATGEVLVDSERLLAWWNANPEAHWDYVL